MKAAILSLGLRPGEQVRPEELAEQLAISRTPIREALLRLETDGLVRVEPRVGFFVADVTAADLVELFELRELLEGYAAERAATALTADDLTTVDRLLADAARAVDGGDLERFQETEVAFHDLVVERAGNRRLLAVMATLRDLTYRQRMLSLTVPENVSRSLQEHRDVATALHAGDGPAARVRMAAHLRAARDRLLAHADLSPPGRTASGHRHA